MEHYVLKKEKNVTIQNYLLPTDILWSRHITLKKSTSD